MLTKLGQINHSNTLTLPDSSKSSFKVRSLEPIRKKYFYFLKIFVSCILCDFVINHFHFPNKIVCLNFEMCASLPMSLSRNFDETFYIIFLTHSLIILYFICWFHLFSPSILPWKLLPTQCSNVDWLVPVEVLYWQPQCH